MASKYKGLVPEQSFLVLRYSKPQTKWQRILQRPAAKGVWVPAMYVDAYTGQEACSIARKNVSVYNRKGTRLKAIPTWNTILHNL